MRNPLGRLVLLGVSLLAALQVPSMLRAGEGPLQRSKHFAIENTSDASDQELQDLLTVLERAHAEVARLLGKAPPAFIRVMVQQGEGIPSARGGRLWLYRTGGRIQAEAAAHELVHLTTGYTSSPPIEEGLAVYVAETLAPHQRRLFPHFGKPVDAWVELFRQRGTLLPLARVLGTIAFHWDLRGSPEDALAWQTYLEAGSFVRWLVVSHGLEVFWQFHQTRSVPATLGATVTDVQHAWLESLARQGIAPTPCRTVLPQIVQRFRVWCEQVDPSGAAPPGGERPEVPEGTERQEAPVPAEVRVVAPGVTVPPELAAFSGQWAGRWDGLLHHRLVVEDILPPHARVIYAWGTAPEWWIDRPGWHRLQGEFVNGALQLALPRPATVRYRLSPDGSLEATYEWTGGIVRTWLTRAQE